MGFTINLLTGLAELLETAGVGSWDPAAAYASGTTGIALVTLPSAPDAMVVLTRYADEDDARLTDALIGVQVRCRGDRNPATVANLADAVYVALHGRRSTLLGTSPNQVRVAQIWRVSSAELGPDANGRHERSDNYYVSVNRGDNDRLE